MGSLLRLKADLGDESFVTALKLSRVDLKHAARLDTLIAPMPGVSLLYLSPFPASLPQADSIPKLLLVSLRLQAFAAYESGRIVTWGPISSGGSQSPTRTGLYHPNWKDRRHVSSVDSTWIMPWTVNIDDRVGTALHQYSLPGRPASHCCIRLLESDARWIYDWIRTSAPGRRGTPVVLFGEYRFELPPPWRSLPRNPGLATLGADEVDDALDLLYGQREAVTSDGD
ncbi:MAG TPA: L,D-transpeptidase [Candidatus Eisenbacteria bacterium]|nr:L,D-transpeptidase [Candidatus Eisenbacteria bacterium]